MFKSFILMLASFFFLPAIYAQDSQVKTASTGGQLEQKKLAAAELMRKEVVTISGRTNCCGSEYLIKLYVKDGAFKVLNNGNTCFPSTLLARFYVDEASGNFVMESVAKSQDISGCTAIKYVIDPVTLEVSSYELLPSKGVWVGPYRKIFKSAS